MITVIKCIWIVISIFGAFASNEMLEESSDDIEQSVSSSRNSFTFDAKELTSRYKQMEGEEIEKVTSCPISTETFDNLDINSKCSEDIDANKKLVVEKNKKLPGIPGLAQKVSLDNICMEHDYKINFNKNKKTTTDEQNYTSVQLVLQTSDSYGNTKLHDASKNGNEETVKLLLHVFAEEESEKLIEYVTKENKIKYTALHFASQNGNEEIVRLLFHAFEKSEKLIEYLIKESKTQYTALHFASQSGNQEIIKLFFKQFKNEKKEKLIEYLMKESKTKNTALHYASKNGHEEIVKLMLNEFGTKEKCLLIRFLMKENDKKNKAIDVASICRNKKVVTLLSETLANVKDL